MWVSKVFSAAAANIDIPIVCNEHQSNDMQSCGDDSYKEEELYKVLLYIKIKVLDPFLFLTSYSSKLLTYWAIESGILPDSGYISQKDVKEHKETICSVDCIVNFSLLALTKVCFPCAKKNDQPAEWFCNTSDDKETCNELKNCLHLNEAIKCVEKYNSIIKKINEQIEMDEQAVAAVFLITFMLRYEAFELSSLQSICKRADDRILEVDQIFVCNNFIGKNEACKISEYHNFINVYSMLLKARPKDVVLLYKRLKAYLALGMNIDAELDGVRLVTLLPTWCKGYHALASVLSFQGLLHSAHKIADIGSMNCKNPLNCLDIVLLKESKEMWMSKCTWCNVQQNESSPVISNVNFVGKPMQSILSQTEDLPGLTDPSDSEESSHGEDLCDVPDLTDPSDSEESSEIDEKVPFGNSMEGKLDQRNALWSVEDMKLNKKKRKHGRYKLSISRIKNENDENCPAEKLQYFESLLKEGLLAMKSGSAHEALRKYHAALMEHKSYPQVCNLSEWDVICLKYAYGSACCDSGNFEDLNKAIGTFTDIMNSSNLSIIPTILYGLGHAYFKLNRFKEALGHFKRMESYFDNEENFPIFYWPNTKDVIEETSPKNLKVELENLINKCENPPLPLATCRHEHCLLTTEIYSCDPNFKGFYSIQCQDKCLLQYHPACWKSIKESLDRTDKDFLGQQCLTPDCEFIVTVVMCFGKDESPEKCFMIQENEKSKKQKKTKLKKKLESKEIKKKNSKKINLTQITVSESSENFGNQEQNSREIQNVVIEEQIIANDEVIKKEVSNKVPEKVESGLSVDAKPFFFQKKYDMEKEIQQKDCDKTGKPMTLCAEEFHSQSSNFSYYNEYQKRLHVLQENKRIVEERNLTHWSTFCETYRNPELDPTRPFHIPEGLREDPEALDAVLQSYNTLGETDVLRTLKDSMFGYFEDILTSNGPMHFDDCRLLAEIPGFSDEFQKLIENSGGLKKFLLQSMRFAVVGDHVCVIQDVVKAYSVASKLQNSKKVYESDDCDDIFFSSATEKNIAENELYNGFHSYLNPHALEYNPCTNQNSSISSPANFEPSDIQFINCNSFPCDKRNELDTVDSARSSHNSADVIQLFFSKNSDPFSEAVCDSKNIFDQFETDGFDKEPEGVSFSTIPCETFINPSPSPSSPIISSKNMSVTISHKEENVCSISDHFSVSDYQTVIPLHLSKQQDKSIQVGTPQVKISKDVMEKDNEYLLEFKKIKELENNLKLKSEHMDNVLEILSNDVEVAKKKCEKVCEYWESKRKISEENESKANEQLEAFSEKYKILCERFNRKCEMSEKMKEFLRQVEMNLESERKAKCEIQASLKSAAEDQEKIVAEMKKQVMNAELRALTVRKANVLEKIDSETKNAQGKIKELEDGLKMCEKNLPAFYLDGFMKLHCEMEEYIKELKDIRSKFLLCADEHKSAIQKEQTCDDLPSLTMPILPKFPSLKPQCLDVPEHLMNKMLDPMQPAAMYFQPQNAPVLCSLSGFNSVLPTVVSHNNFQTSIYNNSCELPEKNVSGNNVVINQFPFSMTQNVSAKSLKKAAPPGLAPQINAVQSRFSTVDNSFSSPVVNSPPCTSLPMSPSCPVVLNAPCQANAVQKMQTLDKCSAVSNPDFENLDSLNDSTLNSANDVCPSISKGHSAVQGSELYTLESSTPSSNVKAIEEIIAVSECSETPVKLQDFSKSSQLSSIPPAYQSKPKNFTLPKTSVGSKKKSISNQDMLSDELENDTSVPLNFENAKSKVNPCSFTSVKSSENFCLSGHNSSVSVLSFTGDDSKLQHKSQAKNSYEKLLVKLQGRYPHLSRGELMNHVTTYRQRCNNKLTGIPLDQIVSNVSLIIENCYPGKKVKLSKPKVLVNKPSLPPHDSKSSAGPVEKTMECPWANALARDKPKWRGEPVESSCAVCLEEMNNSSAYTADCGHIFHLLCIRKWLQTTSNCPVCRTYVLLPEDYPSLD